MNTAERAFKRAIMAQLARSVSDFVELNDVPEYGLDDGARKQVIDELAAEFQRRSAGRWRSR